MTELDDDLRSAITEVAECPTSDESPGTAPDEQMDKLIYAARAVLQRLPYTSP